MVFSKNTIIIDSSRYFRKKSPMKRKELLMKREYSLGNALSVSIFHLVFGSIFTFIGAMVTLIFFIVGGDPRIDWKLEKGETSKAIGKVLSVVYKRNIHANNKHPYDIKYTFQVKSKHYTNSYYVYNQKIAHRAKVSGNISIIYLINNPNINKIDGIKASIFGKLIFLPIAIFVVGLLFLFGGIIRVRKRIRLLKNGQETKGIITSKTLNRKARVNRKYQLIIEYKYKAHGDDYQGKFKSFNHDTYGNLQEGDEITIIYDDFFPDRSTAI